MSENKTAFRLAKIAVEEYATISINKIQDNPDINIDLQFSAQKETRMIATRMSFTFRSEGMPFIILKALCIFEVEEQSWEKSLSNPNALKLPKNFLDHLAVITTGTSRGILYAKTENTEFSKYFIPTMNLNEMVKGEIEFNFPEVKTKYSKKTVKKR